MNKWLEIIQSFKRVKPDAGFVEHSRKIVLESAASTSPSQYYFSGIKRRLRESFNFALGLGLATILIYVLLTGISQSGSNSVIADLEEKQLLSDAQKLDLDIHLQEAQYYKVAPNVIVVVLNKDKN